MNMSDGWKPLNDKVSFWLKFWVKALLIPVLLERYKLEHNMVLDTQEFSEWLGSMGYNLLINGIY